jgi:hypothetical protein
MSMNVCKLLTSQWRIINIHSNKESSATLSKFHRRGIFRNINKYVYKWLTAFNNLSMFYACVCGRTCVYLRVKIIAFSNYNLYKRLMHCYIVYWWYNIYPKLRQLHRQHYILIFKVVKERGLDVIRCLFFPFRFLCSLIFKNSIIFKNICIYK